MPSEARFHQVVAVAGSLANASSPTPKDFNDLARAVKELAQLCAEQQREIDELKRMGQSGGRRFT